MLRTHMSITLVVRGDTSTEDAVCNCQDCHAFISMMSSSRDYIMRKIYTKTLLYLFNLESFESFPCLDSKWISPIIYCPYNKSWMPNILLMASYCAIANPCCKILVAANWNSVNKLRRKYRSKYLQFRKKLEAQD